MTFSLLRRITPFTSLLVLLVLVGFVFPSPFAPLTYPFRTVLSAYTHHFRHANLPHLLFNLAGLCSLGFLIERRIGTLQLIIFYLVSAPLNALFVIAFSTPNAVGISGFLFSLITLRLFSSLESFRFLVVASLTNVVPWLVTLLARRPVSLLGHFAGIFSAFCYIYGFLDVAFPKMLEVVDAKLSAWLSMINYAPLGRLHDASHADALKTLRHALFPAAEELPL